MSTPFKKHGLNAGLQKGVGIDPLQSRTGAPSFILQPSSFIKPSLFKVQKLKLH